MKRRTYIKVAAMIILAILLYMAAAPQPISALSYVPAEYIYKIGIVENVQWKNTSKGWTAYGQDGKQIKHKWVKWNSEHYLIGQDGIMVTGWFSVPGEEVIRFYFDASGRMVTQWLMIDYSWHYFEPNGVHVENGWVSWNDKWYFMGTNVVDGRMHVGWLPQSYRGRTFYMNVPNGDMATGWKKIEGEWYYFAGNGEMFTNKWLQYKGEWYYMKNDGMMMHDEWHKHKGEWYYFKSGGEMMHSGKMKIGGKVYEFDSTGRQL